jgi:hypothetical protein
MLNTRIEIETKEFPYKINRKKPTFLESYFEENIEWIIFCDNLDHRLQKFPEIKAKWMILGVVFTLFIIGIVIGIALRYTIVKDDEIRLILSRFLFGGGFIVVTTYLCLIQKLVIKPLDRVSSFDDT